MGAKNSPGKSLRRDGVERAEAERKTRAYMRSMPLWRDHPALGDA